MPAGYRVLPEIYDRWQATYGSDFSSLVLPRLLTTLDRFPIPETTLADIACGTGTFAIAMARRGWQVWGIDASQEMVDASRRKAEEFSQSPALSTRDTRNVAHSAAFSARDLPDAVQTLVFSCQDMRHFVLPARVGLVTSFFDSVNHLLTLSDIRAFFRSSRQVLQPGGLLIFDVNNESCYRKLWKGATTVEHHDFTLVLKNSYVPSRHRAYSRVFVRYLGEPERPPGSEVVEERCYSREEITRALDREGFGLLIEEDFAFSSSPEFGKLKTWWVARAV